MSNTTQPALVDMPVSHGTLLLIGPIYLGSLLSLCLFGISIMQLYVYHIAFPRDSYIIKVSVYSVFVLDIFQSITMIALGWSTLCSGWGRPAALLTLNWSFSAVPGVTGFVAAWVQIFYAWRIFKIGEWRIIPGIIVAVALAQCAAALSIAIGIPSLSDVTELHLLYKRTIVWLGGAAGADVIIAVSMLYLLFTVRRSKFQRTARILNRLIRLTVETGVITATSALLELIMFQVFQTNNLHIFFAAILCKVYSNALMTSLNSRASNEKEHGANAASDSRVYSTFSAPSRHPVATAPIVHVSTVTDMFEPSKRSMDMSKRNDFDADVEMGTMASSYTAPETHHTDF